MVAGLVALSVAFVVVTLAHLLFAVWLVRRTGTTESLRDAAPYIREIPTWRGAGPRRRGK